MSRMKDFVETTNLKKLQASRQAERKAAEREQGKRQKQLHKVHGSGAAASHAVFVVVTSFGTCMVVWQSEERTDNTTSFVVNLMRSQVIISILYSYLYVCIYMLYRAAQDLCRYQTFDTSTVVWQSCLNMCVSCYCTTCQPCYYASHHLFVNDSIAMPNIFTMHLTISLTMTTLLCQFVPSMTQVCIV